VTNFSKLLAPETLSFVDHVNEMSYMETKPISSLFNLNQVSYSTCQDLVSEPEQDSEDEPHFSQEVQGVKKF
jgi:hypothetical protein